MISSIFVAIHTVCFIIGCLFNLLLCHVAIFHSPPLIKTYSIIVINMAMTNVGVCICDFMLQQRMIPSGFNLFYISYGPCVKFGPEICFDLYSILLHFYSHSLWLIFFAFSYRYYVMVHKAPSRWLLQLIIFIVYIPSVIMMVALILDHTDPEVIRKELKARFPKYELSGLTVSGSANTLTFAPMFAIIQMTVLSTPIVLGILLFRRKIIKHLTYDGVDLTSKTVNLHAQLLKALTTQATIPLFYLLGVACYFTGQFGIWNHPILEFSGFTFCLLVPILSPITSLVYVSPYTQYVQKLLQLKNEHVESPKSKWATTSVHALGN